MRLLAIEKAQTLPMHALQIDVWYRIDDMFSLTKYGDVSVWIDMT